MGQQLVFADAGEDELLEILAAGEGLVQARWHALCDGSPQEYVFAFDGDSAATAAGDLMAILGGAQIHARRVGVVELGTAEDAVAAARRRRRLARRARLSAETRRAS
jgi:hypothetical protein